MTAQDVDNQIGGWEPEEYVTPWLALKKENRRLRLENEMLRKMRQGGLSFLGADTPAIYGPPFRFKLF